MFALAIKCTNDSEINTVSSNCVTLEFNRVEMNKKECMLSTKIRHRLEL